jgi:Glycosyl hydrolase family 79 C-terminal beta domain
MPRSFLGLAAVVVAVLAGAASAGARQPLHVGVADDASLFGDPLAAQQTVAEWQREGIDTVRIQLSWARIAPDQGAATMPAGFNPTDPNSPGYNWSAIDRAVDLVVAAGMDPILMLDGPPPLWASSKPSLNNPRYRPRATAFGPFAAAVAKRYGDRVDRYILWNEPNLPLWLQPQATCKFAKRCTPVSPDLYRAMVGEAYKPIHDADPGAVVLIGALAPSGSNLMSDNAAMRPLQFLRSLACVDVHLVPIASGRCATFQPVPLDGLSYHPHSTRHAPDQPYANPGDADLASLSKVERLLDQLQQRGRLHSTTTPINLWLDEYGYQTDPPDKARGVSLARQDRYLQQAAYLAWRRPRVQLLANYLWNDEKLGGGRLFSGWQSGLIDLNGRDKPALANFANPMWIDTKRSAIWGQVRPGGQHTVVIEMRPPGVATSWQQVAAVVTAPDGSWWLSTNVVPYGSYRATSEDGERTATLVAADEPDDGPASGAVELSARGVPVVRRTISVGGGIPIPPSFAGLSIEYWSAQDYLGSGGRVNRVFAGLIDTLRDGGRSAPTIRLGGNSTDETWWNPGNAARPPGSAVDLNDGWISQLRAWTTATATPMLLGVNFALDDPANALGYVQAATTALGRRLAGFEVGNEPDRYAQPHTFHVGARAVTRAQRRPPDYSFQQYTSELGRFVSTLAPAAGASSFAGGVFAGGGWDSNTDALLDGAGPAVRAFDAHSYGVQACGAAARKRTKASFAATLLAPSGTAPIVARVRHLAAVARAHGAAFRVSEANSANCGGVDGVSNAFASTLWGADLLFGLAQAGAANVDFHAWTGANYSPVDFFYANGRTVGKVRPLFYSLLLFNRAVPAGARLLTVPGNSPSSSTKTWATIDKVGTRRIVLLNKDSQRPREVVLSVPGAAAKARVERLAAPSVLAKKDVTFAGQSFGASTTDGRLIGRHVTERLKRRHGRFRLLLPPGSAALVTVGGSRVSRK